MYLLITVYIDIYMCIEIVIIYISIYVSSMKLFFDRCVPKIVCRCVISLCAIWSWDLVGQCLHSGVCVQMCILYVVSATEVHGWEGFRARWRDLTPCWSLRGLLREEMEMKNLVHTLERSFSTFQSFWCSECLRMQKWLEKC